jgi:hypothetical protein
MVTVVHRYIFALIKLLVVILWPLTVAAAAVTASGSVIVDPFIAITTIHVLVMLVISTLSGLTALTIRIDFELRNKNIATLPRPLLFVSSHMLGCWLAGVVAVALSQQQVFSVWTEITSVVAASFMGAKFIEKISEFYVGRIVGVPEVTTITTIIVPETKLTDSINVK